MAQIRCEKVSRGLRPDERSVTVRNAVTGEHSSLRVPTDYLTMCHGDTFLPVGIVQDEPAHGLVLVELTQDTDVGPRRLWVRTSDLLSAVKTAS